MQYVLKLEEITEKQKMLLFQNVVVKSFNT